MSYSTVITKEEAAKQLGITDISSDLKLIRAAYRRMALLYHPDVATRSKDASHEVFTEKAKLFKILLANDETDWESDQAEMLAETKARKEWAESSEEETQEIIKTNVAKAERDEPVLATLEELLATHTSTLADTDTTEDNNAILAQLLEISYKPSLTPPTRRSEPKVARSTASVFSTGAKGAGAGSARSKERTSVATPSQAGDIASVKKQLFSSPKPSPARSTRRELEALIQEIEALRNVSPAEVSSARTLEALLLDAPLIMKTPTKPAISATSPFSGTAAYVVNNEAIAEASTSDAEAHDDTVGAAIVEAPAIGEFVTDAATPDAHLRAATPPAAAPAIGEFATDAATPDSHLRAATPPAAAPAIGELAASAATSDEDDAYINLHYQMLEKALLQSKQRINRSYFDLFLFSANKADAIENTFNALKNAIIKEIGAGVDSKEFKQKLLEVIEQVVVRNEDYPTNNNTDEQAKALRAALLRSRFIQKQAITPETSINYVYINDLITTEINKCNSSSYLNQQERAIELNNGYSDIKKIIQYLDKNASPEEHKRILGTILKQTFKNQGKLSQQYNLGLRFAAENFYKAVTKRRYLTRSTTEEAIYPEFFSDTSKALEAVIKVARGTEYKYEHLEKTIGREIKRLRGWSKLFSISSKQKADDIEITYINLRDKVERTYPNSKAMFRALVEICEYMMVNEGNVAPKYEAFREEARNLYFAINRPRSFGKSKAGKAVWATLFASAEGSIEPPREMTATA